MGPLQLVRWRVPSIPAGRRSRGGVLFFAMTGHALLPSLFGSRRRSPPQGSHPSPFLPPRPPSSNLPLCPHSILVPSPSNSALGARVASPHPPRAHLPALRPFFPSRSRSDSPHDHPFAPSPDVSDSRPKRRRLAAVATCHSPDPIAIADPPCMWPALAVLVLGGPFEALAFLIMSGSRSRASPAITPL